MSQGEVKHLTKISALWAKNGQCWYAAICGSSQFECSSVTMGTQNCELMYSELCVTV